MADDDRRASKRRASQSPESVKKQVRRMKDFIRRSLSPRNRSSSSYASPRSPSVDQDIPDDAPSMRSMSSEGAILGSFHFDHSTHMDIDDDDNNIPQPTTSHASCGSSVVDVSSDSDEYAEEVDNPSESLSSEQEDNKEDALDDHPQRGRTGKPIRVEKCGGTRQSNPKSKGKGKDKERTPSGSPKPEPRHSGLETSTSHRVTESSGDSTHLGTSVFALVANGLQRLEKETCAIILPNPAIRAEIREDASIGRYDDNYDQDDDLD
ncbi:hypothetical protein BDZ89DRAFT_1118355 [Hymenopellis radicata]|nr:hypothetical protein BDZ89DRAFT_1118355 [Hymenopellis radicata]